MYRCVACAAGYSRAAGDLKNGTNTTCDADPPPPVAASPTDAAASSYVEASLDLTGYTAATFTPSVARRACSKSSPPKAVSRKVRTVAGTSRTSYTSRPTRWCPMRKPSTRSLYSAPTRRVAKRREKTPWIDKSRESNDNYESDT